MARQVQLAVDCDDPDRLAAFWAAVLDYRIELPPGHASWSDFSRAAAVEPGEAWSKIVDPNGHGPALFFHRVPEAAAAKVGKNRLHLDVHAPKDAAGDDRQRVDAEVGRVVALGARRLRAVADDAGYFVVLRDPEGNEFCID